MRRLPFGFTRRRSSKMAFDSCDPSVQIASCASEEEGVVLIQDAARDAAEKILHEYWDSVESDEDDTLVYVRDFPIDPVAIARDLGIKVSFGRLRDGLSGAIVAEEGKVRALISSEDGSLRQSFTCAHELGHFVERQEAGDSTYSFEEQGRSSGQLRDDYMAHEFYADEFAGNLLMPEEDFLDLSNNGMKIPELAAYFGVSRDAVKKRVRRLRQMGKLKE